MKLYSKYRDRAGFLSGVTFGGRLGEYSYFDMDRVVEKVLTVLNKVVL